MQTNNSYSLNNCIGADPGLLENNSSIQIPGSDLGLSSSTQSITVSLDYKWDGQSQVLFNLVSPNDNGNSMQIRIGDGGLWFDPGDGWDHLYGCSIPSDTQGTYYHFAFVFNTGAYDNSRNAIYINGVRQSMHYCMGPAAIDSTDYFTIDGNEELGLFDNAAQGNSAASNIDVYNSSLTDTEAVYDAEFASSTHAQDANTEWFSDAMYGNIIKPNGVCLHLGTNGINGYNYLKLTGQGDSDSSAEMYMAVQPNTVYTISAYVKLPKSGTNNTHGTILFPTDASNGSPLTVISSSGSCYTATDWKRVWTTFNSGNNSNIFIRTDRADIPEVDATAYKLEQSDHSTPFISYGQDTSYEYGQVPELNSFYNIKNPISYKEDGYMPTSLYVNGKISFQPVSSSIVNHSGETMQLSKRFTQQIEKDNISSEDTSQFPNSIAINQDGYTGTIPRTGIDWTPNWVTNRYSNVQTATQTSSWVESLSSWNYPAQKTVTVYDSTTGQNITGNISSSGTPHSVASATKTFHSIASGRVENRYIPGQWTAWFSNNSSSYFGGAYSYYDFLPRPFQDYYGPDANTGTWHLANYSWGDSRAYSASEEGESSWISDGEYGGVHANSWARGVYLDYIRTAHVNKYEADYSGQVKLPDYISDYNGTATYDDTLTQNVSNPGYKTATQWNVTINYAGKEEVQDNPPVANFNIKNKIYVGDSLNVQDNSYDPDTWDSINTRDWYYENYVSDNYSSTPNSSYNSTTLEQLNSGQFNSTGRYSIREKVTDNGNSPYSGPLSNEYNGSTTWHDVKVYPRNTKPTAKFTVDNVVKTNQALTYQDFSTPNDNKMSWNGSINDKITAWDWQWSTDEVNWTDGKPTSFPNEGVYYIRLHVQDNGNYIPDAQDKNNDSLDDRLWSDWTNPETVVVKNNILPLNIHANNISVVDMLNNEVNQVVNGNTYKIKFTFTNNSNNDITDKFNVDMGFDVSGSDDQTCTSLGVNQTVTYYSKAFTLNTGSNIASFDAYANNTRTVIETNYDDNALSIRLPVVDGSLSPPTADFTANTPIAVNQQEIYSDNSHVNQAGASITNRIWYWSDDNTNWNFGIKTTFDLTEDSFSSTCAYGDYYIKEMVIDSNNQASTWAYKTIRVYKIAKAPTPRFTVTPTVQLVQANVNYSDTSYLNDNWEKIVHRQWEYRKDGGDWTILNVDVAAPSTFSSPGTYDIQERVQGSGSQYSTGVWSDWGSKQTITILPINTVPNAAFTVTPNPQYITGNLVYIDNSNAGDSWDTLKSETWNWCYSSDGGSTWSNWQSAENANPPSHFNNIGSYKIRLTVTDTGNALSGPKTASATQTVNIVKPNSKFSLNSNTAFLNVPIIYTDMSTTNNQNNPIGQRLWSYRFSDGGSTWSNWSIETNLAPQSFGVPGLYQIREKISSTANSIYPLVWSDYYSQEIQILDETVVGTVNHTDNWNKNRINYNMEQTGTQDQPRGINVFFPGENFILNATTTSGANAQSVNVQIDGTTFSTTLTKSGDNQWSGELWDQSMVHWQNQTVKFIFTAQYPYGVVKTYTTSVEINDGGGGYWLQHSEF